MIDYHKELVSALNSVLPTHYELALTSKTKLPCISYQERNNYATESGDTLGYSRIIYTIKIWGRFEDAATIQAKALEMDAVLRSIGFKRTSSNELAQSTMFQKIFTYEALAYEKY